MLVFAHMWVYRWYSWRNIYARQRKTNRGRVEYIDTKRVETSTWSKLDLTRDTRSFSRKAFDQLNRVYGISILLYVQSVVAMVAVIVFVVVVSLLLFAVFVGSLLLFWQRLYVWFCLWYSVGLKHTHIRAYSSTYLFQAKSYTEYM